MLPLTRRERQLRHRRVPRRLSAAQGARMLGQFDRARVAHAVRARPHAGHEVHNLFETNAALQK